MPGIFSRINKARDARQRKKNALNDLENSVPAKPKWDDAYTRPSVEPEEIEDLIKCCTEEIKARGLDHPFLLLPFRPTSDPSGVRTFIRNFFDNNPGLSGEPLTQELRMAEPMVLAGIIKWCWSRLQGGVVSWDAYELFKVGEYDSRMDRDAFKTFIPLSVDSDSRQNIIFTFFDLMAAIAAHANTNGFGGRKLSRMAAWWAFEHKETSNGFDGGYKAWAKAADATTHLFFAYLRSQTPELGLGGISMIPRSLEKLLREVEYPPQPSNLLMTKTNKLVMIVDSVSPTPFALLRRASHFQYRDSDVTLQRFSQYEDPVSALTEECVRVLKAISAANQSQVSSAKHSTSLRDASWSRFEDIGFSSALNEETEDTNDFLKPKPPTGLRSSPTSGCNDLGRPTTPSWADFLSAGFNDENAMKSNVLLPPDKVLPPIDIENRQRSSQSHRPRLESDQRLEPGELASITTLALDDAFWWVWMNSLAPEETPVRKSAFGRCAVVETKIGNGQWLVLEEVVTGAAPEPEDGAYIAEKKGFFSWTKRSKTVSRRKSISAKKRDQLAASDSKTSIDTETQAKIHAKAVQLRAIQEQDTQNSVSAQRRGRNEADLMSEKTNSVFALQPQIAGEATSALKWVKKYDKGAVKDAYLSNEEAGKGHALPQSTSNLLDYATSQAHHSVNATSAASPDVAISESSQPQEASTSHPTEPLADNEQDSGSSNEPQQAEESSPAPPPKDETPAADPSQALPPARSSSGMQQRFNQAKEAKEKGPLRKLFSRKNRSSKVPDSYSADLNKMLEEHDANTEKSAAPSTSAEETQDAENSTSVEQLTTSAQEPELTPISPETSPVEDAAHAEPTLNDDNLAQAEVSPVEKQSGSFKDQSPHINADDASEAKQEFSRFDQGPLVEQPAFVPESDDNEVEATPTSQKTRREGNGTASSAKDELSQSAGPGVQDRWAQIRKNAANRAAQRQADDRSHTVASKTSDGDDDTSGEETIESRVARIKARVAELTGNMEGTSSPSLSGVNRP